MRLHLDARRLLSHLLKLRLLLSCLPQYLLQLRLPQHLLLLCLLVASVASVAMILRLRMQNSLPAALPVDQSDRVGLRRVESDEEAVL